MVLIFPALASTVLGVGFGEVLQSPVGVVDERVFVAAVFERHFEGFEAAVGVQVVGHFVAEEFFGVGIGDEVAVDEAFLAGSEKGDVGDEDFFRLFGHPVFHEVVELAHPAARISSFWAFLARFDQFSPLAQQREQRVAPDGNLGLGQQVLQFSGAEAGHVAADFVHFAQHLFGFLRLLARLPCLVLLALVPRLFAVSEQLAGAVDAHKPTVFRRSDNVLPFFFNKSSPASSLITSSAKA